MNFVRDNFFYWRLWYKYAKSFLSVKIRKIENNNNNTINIMI